jgi:hypothetical protein
MSGYSGTPLAQQLGIRAGNRVYLHGPPGDYAQLVTPLPPGVEIVTRPGAKTDIVHIFAVRRSALHAALQRIIKRLRPDAAVWVSSPKKTARVTTDITGDMIRKSARGADTPRRSTGRRGPEPT